MAIAPLATSSVVWLRHVTAKVQSQEVNVINDLADTYLKVLELLDPECKHLSLEDAARNALQVKQGLKQVHDALAEQMQSVYKKLQAEVMEHRFSFMETCECETCERTLQPLLKMLKAFAPSEEVL